MYPGEVIVFDVETTGTDRQRDQVIELCVQMGLESDSERLIWRMRPSVPINPGAQAVHGITMEDLADCQPFAAYAGDIRALFSRAQVLVGYNMSFDIDMLQAEYERLRQPFLALEGKQLVDAFRLWQQCEPRSLQHAHQRFVGDSFQEAHSASADVAATSRVLRGMIRDFGLAGRDWGTIARVCEPERSTWVGPSRHVRWEQGVVVLGFGKHAGMPMHVVAGSEHRDYLQWVLGKDFPRHVHAICRAALELAADEFLRWVMQTFGNGVAEPRPMAAMQQGVRRAAGH
jgi:DNA polymerase III subunit epsilon